MNEEKQRQMKILLKFFWRLCLLILSALLLYFIIAITLSFLPSTNIEITETKNKEIYIQSNGTHLDIVVPVEHLDSNFTKQLNLPHNTQYVCFGWGNKEFFFNVPEWKDLSFGLAFRAAFFRLESAMHVIAYSHKKEDWLTIKIGQLQQVKLNNFIENSFAKKEHAVLLCKRNANGNNCFYDAKGKYSCINTCNVWVNDALKEAHVKTSIWSPFHWGVLYHLN
jgi:uncharacterized protein (TIGR02117 family)